MAMVWRSSPWRAAASLWHRRPGRAGCCRRRGRNPGRDAAVPVGGGDGVDQRGCGSAARSGRRIREAPARRNGALASGSGSRKRARTRSITRGRSTCARMRAGTLSFRKTRSDRGSSGQGRAGRGGRPAPPGGSGADEGGAPGRGGLQQYTCHNPGPGGAADGGVIQSGLLENGTSRTPLQSQGNPQHQVRPVRSGDRHEPRRDQRMALSSASGP